MKNYSFKTTKWIALAPLAAGVLLPGAAWAGNAKVCFEAEKAVKVETPLKVVNAGKSSKYSGSGFLDIPWDKNKTKGIGSATYRVKVQTAGTYYLWARTFWANGCGNSIAMSVNGGSTLTLGEDGTYDKWHWVGGTSGHRVKLHAGVNTFVIKNRETGVRVDQVFLAEDGNYTPVGIRKITS